MSVGLNRRDLREFAERNLRDAALLFENGRFSNAYYLGGYSVELALKACIAATIAAETVPDTAILKGFLTHDFARLVGLAGLEPDFKSYRRQHPEFEAHWAVVSEWSPERRYESGVMQWIQMHW